MHIPPELIIHQTRHWTLNQRIDSALPGYCMLGSRQPATAFHQLPEQALAEFGPLLAGVEREMDALLRRDASMSAATATCPVCRCIST